MKIAVYCGSREGTNFQIIQKAKELGKWIGEEGHTLVYGASAKGLMGAVADAVLEAGGKVIGIIPEFLTDVDPIHSGLTQLEIVEDMSCGKKRMIDLADVAIAIPGGPGTLEEISEVISWSIIGHTDTQAITYNMEGFYDPLQAMYQQMVKCGYLSQEAHEAIHFATSMGDVERLIKVGQNEKREVKHP